MKNKEQQEKWAEAFGKQLEYYESFSEPPEFDEVFFDACEYMQKKIDVLVEAIKIDIGCDYDSIGLHSEHCGKCNVLEKLKELEK